MLAKRITRIQRGDTIMVEVSGGVRSSCCPCDGYLIHTTQSDDKTTTPIFVPDLMLSDANKSKKEKRRVK